MTSTGPDLSDPGFIEFLAKNATPADRAKFGPYVKQLAERRRYDWSLQARPEQLPPAGDWLIWLLITGRRWGKTRSAAEWLRNRASQDVGSYAICAPTYGDVRDICVEGGQKEPVNRRSGFLTVCPPGEIANYNRSLGEIRMSNGSKIKMLSADEPDRARGWGFNAAWCDEFSSWRYPATWYETLLPAVSMSDTQRFIITTTPKPNKLTRDLIARSADDDSIVLVRGRTLDNAQNLGKGVVEELRKQMSTRMARQELEGELLTDVEGALWKQEWLDEGRVRSLPTINRRIIAVDPSDGDAKGDGYGVTVASLGEDGHGYVEFNEEWRNTPAEMASATIQLYKDLGAGLIVIEKNHGGKWIPAYFTKLNDRVNVDTVTASEGKITRAEPVAAYFQDTPEHPRLCHLVGVHPELEDELTNYTGKPGQPSPDRLDSMVWALTELMESVEESGFFWGS